MGTAVRLGFICPSSDTTFEPAAAALMAGYGTAHFTRIPVAPIGPEDESDRHFDVDAMVTASRQLAHDDVDVVAWAGISGLWLGLEREHALRDELATSSNTPVTTAALALLAACHGYGVRRLGLVSPYSGEILSLIVKQFGSNDIHVTAHRQCGPTTPDVEAMIHAAADDADAVAVVCADVDGVTAATRAEAALGIPVFDSIAATVWHSMMLAGGTPAVDRSGDLMANGAFRSRLQTIVERLRTATGGDRTTLRLDWRSAGLSVGTCAAECCGPSVRSIRRDGTLPQRDLATVRWLDQHRVALIQPDFTGDPRPPDALLDVYGVRAQMLGPLLRDGGMPGWLSVHSLAERTWSAADQDALSGAARQVQAVLDTHVGRTVEVM
jgi:maleate isomerase